MRIPSGPMADTVSSPPRAISVPQDFFPDPTGLLWAVSDPARWAVLRELAGGQSRSVLELSAVMGRSADLASKHLKHLREAGAVATVDAPDGDKRKQHFVVPERFRRTDESGRAMIDYGACVLRFPLKEVRNPAGGSAS